MYFHRGIIKRHDKTQLLTLSSYSKVSENDPFPKLLCVQCKENLIKFHSFRQLCFETEKKWKTLFHSKSIDINEESDLSDGLSNEDRKTESNDHLYPCNICNKVLHTKYTFNRHLKIHSDDVHLQCKVCAKRFSRATDVKRHMTLHTGLKPYKCKVCDASFTQSGTLAQHVRKHKEFQNVKEKQNKIVHQHLCPLCGKCFKESTSLTIHIRRHTNDKPFECKVCNMW